MKKVEPLIINLIDIFDKKYWLSFMNIVNEIAGYNKKESTFSSPSFARNAGFTFKSCALKVQLFNLLRDHSTTKVEEWIFCYDQQYYSHIGRNAELCLKRKQRASVKKLPEEKDVKLLNDYLSETIEQCMKRLKNEFQISAWKLLGKALMVTLLVFNRRRVGDMENLLIEDMKKKHEIDKEADYYNQLTVLEKSLAGNFFRVPMEGKRTRDLFLLVSKEIYSKIEYFLELRKEAGVKNTNKYLFGLKESSTLSATHALLYFSRKCGAKNPETLKSSLLRKSIATFSQLLHLKENEMHNLADFMGHNFQIHSEYYRLPNEVTQMCHLSKLLVALDQGKGSQYIGKNLTEILLDQEHKQDEEDRGEEQDEVDRGEEQDEEDRVEEQDEEDRGEEQDEEDRAVEQDEEDRGEEQHEEDPSEDQDEKEREKKQAEDNSNCLFK
ncbi:hypothetical protein WDU94_010826 [Cyamophila willieti]